MACNEVTILKTDTNIEALQNADEKKQGRYDPSIVKDSMIDSLLFGSEKEIDAKFDELFGKDGIFKGIRSIRDKALALRNSQVDYDVFGPKIGKVEPGEARLLTIAISHLEGVQKAENDSAIKRGLTPTQLATVTSTSSGKIQTSYSNIARSIGRDILKSRGYRLVPKSQKGIELAAAKEIKLGEQALELLASKNKDLITVNNSGTIINRDFMMADEVNKKFTTGSKNKQRKQKNPLISNVKTITFNGLFPEYEDTKEYDGYQDYIQDVLSTSTRIRAVKNLILPSNNSVPSLEAQEINEAFMDIEPTEVTRAVIKHAQKSPLRVTPLFKELFEQLDESLKKESDYKSTKNKLAGLASLVNGTKDSKYIFGTVDGNLVNELYGTDATGISKEYGASNSKFLPILNLLDDADTLLNNDLYYTYQVASQNRLHVIEQTLNYQTDNFLARNILGSPTEQVLDKDGIDYMLGYLVDETKLSVDEILGNTKTKKSENLNTIIEAISDRNNQPILDVAMGISGMMERNETFMSNDKAKSAFGIINYAQAIKDIRDGYASGEVKTHFLVKPDATASGALITVAQAAGRTEAAGEVFGDLVEGFRVFDSNVTEVKEVFKDMYEISSKAFKHKYDSFNPNAKPVGAKAQAEQKAYRDFKSLLSSDIGILSSSRDLIKLPFTKYIYGQSHHNNTLEISKELASMIISQNKLPLARVMLGLQPNDKLPEGQELRDELIRAFNKTDGTGVADTLVSLVEDTTGVKLFNDQAKVLEGIHDSLEAVRFSKNSKYQQIQIVPPLAAIENIKTIHESVDGYADVRSEFGATIEKWKEAVLPNQDGQVTTIKKHFPNRNSIKVLLQHMTDAAILVRSIDAVYAKDEFKDYNNGMMLVHDSIGVGSDFAIALEEEYKKQILEVNKEYDFVEAGLMELKYARSLLDAKAEPELATKIDEQISSLEESLPAIIANKQRILGDKVIETSFGIEPSIKEDVSKATMNKVKQSTSKQTVKPKVKEVKNIKTYGQQELTKLISKMPKALKYTANLALAKNPNVTIDIDPFDNKNSYNLATNTITLAENATNEQVLHELIHAATAQKIAKSGKYARRVQKLYNKVLETNPELLKEIETLSEEERLHEFMALGITNKHFSDTLKQIPVGKRILTAMKRLILEALGLGPKDDNTVYSELLYLLSESKHKSNKHSAELKLNFVDVTKDSYDSYKPSNKKNTSGIIKVTESVAEGFSKADRKIADVIQSTFELSLDYSGNKLGAKKYHEKMMKSSKIYRDTFNAVTRQWDENTLVGKIKVYTGIDKNFDKRTLTKIATQTMHAEERKATFEQEHINKLQTKLSKHFSEDEIAGLHKVLSETPIFNLPPKMLTDILTGSKTIDDTISEIETSTSLTPTQFRNATKIAQGLGKFYINKDTSGHYTTDLRLDTNIADTVSKLSALYALKEIKDVDTLLTKVNASKSTQSIFNELYEMSVAIKTLDKELDSTITYELDKHIGNLNHMVFKDNNELQVVTQNNVNKKMSEGLGWKILRKPTKTEVGIIYRDRGDISYQSGTGTNLKVDPNINLSLPNGYDPVTNKAMGGVKDSPRIILTNKELDELGYLRNPAYSLTKAYTHRQMLLETEGVRELIVKKQVYTDKVPVSQIQKDIKAGTHKWYIKLPEGKTLADMPEEIQKRYTEAHAKSDANGFNDKVDLVRKDAKDFIEGYKEIQIGATGTTLNKAFSILKKSILLQKIHWVITAPAKIARDAISNTAYLMSKNIPITTIYSKSKRIMNDMASLTKIREELLHAEFKNRVSPSPALEAKILKLENDIKKHPLAAAHFNGFVQSLAIELSSKNEHTISGLHKDISSVVGYLFRDDKGALNTAGKAVMGMSKFGINGEDLLISVANKLSTNTKAASPQVIAESLKEMGEHIKELKAQNDIEAYVQEYLATPGSSLVAVGSAAVQAVDVVGKVIDYENEVKIKVKEFVKLNKKEPSKKELDLISENAAQKALENFIDYKINIPREFRFLEQTGVTSFISFTSRIQRVMFNNLRNNPVNALVTIVLNDMLEMHGATIFDANVFDRNIFHTPNLGMDVIFPTKILG